MKGHDQQGEETLVLSHSLGLQAKEVISLVGAGGKTSLMFRLAKELSLDGKRVVTTTTTKILEPTGSETPSLFVDLDEGKIKEFVHHALKRNTHVTIAGERIGSGKLKGVSPEFIVALWDPTLMDYIIVEADGAAGRPVKAPREHEPVIPPHTTLLVALLGVDGVEAELSERNVFQPERVSRITGVPVGGRLTAEAIAKLVTHADGMIKGVPHSSRIVVFLNKVDIPHGLERAKRVGQEILKMRPHEIERVVLGHLRMNPPVVEVLFSE